MRGGLLWLIGRSLCGIIIILWLAACFISPSWSVIIPTLPICSQTNEI